MTGMKANTSNFDQWAKSILSIQKQADGVLQSVIYPYLFVGDQSKQAQRWVSRGASEPGVSGVPWRPLTRQYAARKLRKFAKSPGGGTKLLVATGRLLSANTGRPKEAGDLNKLIMNGTLYVRIGIPYAKFVHRFSSGQLNRNIIGFSRDTYKEMKLLIQDYFHDKVKP